MRKFLGTNSWPGPVCLGRNLPGGRQDVEIADAQALVSAMVRSSPAVGQPEPGVDAQDRQIALTGAASLGLLLPEYIRFLRLLARRGALTSLG